MAHDDLYQTITLDNAQRAVIFTEDGRAFYDVKGIASLLTADITRQVLAATDPETGLDPEQAAYFLGMVDMVTNISMQADCLRDSYLLSNLTDISDLF